MGMKSGLKEPKLVPPKPDEELFTKQLGGESIFRSSKSSRPASVRHSRKHPQLETAQSLPYNQINVAQSCLPHPPRMPVCVPVHIHAYARG